jgi:hypothetical protein
MEPTIGRWSAFRMLTAAPTAKGGKVVAAKKNVGTILGFVLVLVLILALGASAVLAQTQTPEPAAVALGSAFTYQGQLRNASGPVNDTCDFQFSLWDDPSGGGQIGTTQSPPPVNVVDGRFTVALDFGAGAFNGQGRWLAVTVRCPAGGGDYATLSPRQALTAAPYAMYAPSAGSVAWSGVSGKPAGFADNVDNDTLAGLSCANGQVAKWNGSVWVCAVDEGGRRLLVSNGQRGHEPGKQLPGHER